jgi:hypothetical protein
MADTVFIDGSTIINAEWLNSVNELLYRGKSLGDWNSLSFASSSGVHPRFTFKSTGYIDYHFSSAFQSSLQISDQYVFSPGNGYGGVTNSFLTINGYSDANVTPALASTNSILLTGITGTNTSAAFVSMNTSTAFDTTSTAFKRMYGTGFHNIQDGTTDAIFLDDVFGTGTAMFLGRKANGTPAAPTQLVNGSTIAVFGASGYGATGWSSGVRGGMYIAATNSWSDSVQGTSMSFRITNGSTGSMFTALALHSSGNSVTGDTSITGQVAMTGNIALGTSGLVGSNAVNTIAIRSQTSATTTLTGAGQLFVQNGALMYRGASGTLTTLAAS